MRSWSRAVATVLLGAAVSALVVTAPTASAAPSVVDDVAAAGSHAAQRGYRSAVAVLDMDTGGYWTSGDADGAHASESLIKLFIATRLLADGAMTGFNATAAYKMITQSDDAAANTLYGRAGGDANIDWIEQRYGIPWLGSRPPRAGYWGATPVTAHGMVSFYAAVRADPVVWPWLSNAIHDATPYGSDGFYQFFGIPSATSGAGVKQGWGDDTPTGVPQQNSTGVVGGDRFAVAILTQGPGYGGALSDVVTRQAQLLMPGGAVRLPAPPPRVAVVGLDGVLRVKGGDLYGPWSYQASGIVAVDQDGDRLAAVDSRGQLYLKSGPLDSGWLALGAPVEQVALTGDRVVAVTSDGQVLLKTGAPSAPWSAVATGAAEVSASGDRLAVVLDDGTALVKTGGANAPWSVLGGGVAHVVVEGSRVGVVLADGTALVKDGPTTAPWRSLGSGVVGMTLAGDRVGVVTSGAVLLTKEGSVQAPWVVQAASVRTAALAGPRLAILQVDGSVLAKDGALTAPWVLLADRSGRLALG